MLHVRGLPANMPLSERLPRRYSKNPNDVFCIVKHHMSDDHPSQPALLVLPGDELTAVKRFWATSVRHTGEEFAIDPDRQKDLLDLAEAFAKYPNYDRAVAYLKSLGGIGQRTIYPVNEVRFLETGGVHAPDLPCANIQERPPREPPHQLQVRFHRPGNR